MLPIPPSWAWPAQAAYSVVVACAPRLPQHTVLRVPVRTMKINILGTFHVLEAILALGGKVKRFIVVPPFGGTES